VSESYEFINVEAEALRIYYFIFSKFFKKFQVDLINKITHRHQSLVTYSCLFIIHILLCHYYY